MSARNTHEILRLSDGKSFSDITYHQTHLERSQRIKTSHTALRSRFAQSLPQDRFKQLLLHSCFMVVVWYERTQKFFVLSNVSTKEANKVMIGQGSLNFNFETTKQRTHFLSPIVFLMIAKIFVVNNQTND